MTRRRLVALMGAAALAVAACGGGGATQSPGGGGGGQSPAASPGGGGASGSPAGSPAGSPGGGGAAPSFENIGGSVTVVGSWTGAEEESFRAMIAPWAEATGVEVQYSGSRDLAAQLTAGVASGNLPDVAGLPGPGLMKEWYDQGALKPLDFVDFARYESETPPGFAASGQAEDGKLIGIFTKAAVKGLIWYNTEHYDGTEPESWEALNGMDAAPAEALWCVGFESGAASGWPGTDWIEDIVLRQSGPDVYDAWVRGEQKWTSPEIRSAFETLGTVLEKAAGGSNAVATTNFGSAGNGLFTDPPECKFHHQASFITDFFKNEGGAEDGDFDFFVMPDINPQYAGAITTAGDLFGMFNDTPQAQSLIQYLLTAEAQQIWVERGGFISMNRNVPLDAYPDETSRRSAELLAEASAAKFDGSDLMPNAMNEAFFRAIMDFTQNPGNLDQILQTLDETQADAYGG